MMEKSDKEKLNAIYLEIVGQPEFNRKGMRKQLDENTAAIEEMKKKGVKIKWFWAGWGAAAGTGAYATAKSSWFAKLVAAITGAGAADKMIK